jgi:hypothetical protein
MKKHKERDITQELNNEIEKEDGEKVKEERESVTRRKKGKRRDVVSRWSGLILFVLLFAVSFLLWVGGETAWGR